MLPQSLELVGKNQQKKLHIMRGFEENRPEGITRVLTLFYFLPALKRAFWYIRVTWGGSLQADIKRGLMLVSMVHT